MVILACAFEGCEFKTSDLTEPTALTILQSHIYSHASAVDRTSNRVHQIRDAAVAPKLDRPQVDVGVSLEQWNIFVRRWEVFKQGSHIEDASAAPHLFQCATQELGDTLLKCDPDIIAKTVQDLLSEMKRLAVIPTATGVLRSELMQLCQSRDEPFRAFAARVRGKADTCRFIAQCACGSDVNYTDHVIRDTLLNGIYDTDIQREVLGLKDVITSPLNDVIGLIESKEIARNAVPSFNVSAMSSYRRQQRQPQPERNSTPMPGATHPAPQSSTCPRCDQSFLVYRQGPRGWNKKPFSMCLQCHRATRVKRRHIHPPTNYSERQVHQQPHLSTMLPVISPLPDSPPSQQLPRRAALNSHYTYKKGKWSQDNIHPHPTVTVTISTDPCQHKLQFPHQLHTAENVAALADSGAQTNVWSLQDFQRFGFRCDCLVPALNLMAANHSPIPVVGAFFAIIEGASPNGDKVRCRSLVYVSDAVHALYLSMETLMALGIVSPQFPMIGEHEHANTGLPAATLPSTGAPHIRAVYDGCAAPHLLSTESCGCPQRSAVPPLPKQLPFPCIPENNAKMKTWLLERYAGSTFNTCPHRALHAMAGPPIEIHVDPSAKPVASHTPATIPLHWQDQVHRDLLRDETLGILEKVPHGEPSIWCHRMVITRKHDGTPRRTVDLSPLNRFCKRETFATDSPFKLAHRVPQNTWKTVTDAWNGYHSVPLRESDRHLTTFITPFGRWRYTRAPQGFLSSGDGYNKRFDAVLSDFLRKERCVDDTVFYDDSLNDHWWRTMQFLTIVGQAGIILNPDKFQFAQQTVDFAGFRISSSTLEPLPKYLKAIQNFPTPSNVSDIRSWFGLVNQVAHYAQLRDLLAPFKPFLSPKRKFEWSDELDHAFTLSKDAIVAAIRQGVEIFDTHRRTCLRPDWSKRGLGYFLLQKHCGCSASLPGCCQNGWHITLAGSRFLSSAEQRYAPIEGEALAVAWGLEQTKYFTQGCDNLVVVTDHRPLVKIFGDRTLDEITNTRLFRLKQRTLMWRFDIAYMPGSENCAADAASRHPTKIACDHTTEHPLSSHFPDFAEETLIAGVQKETSSNFNIQWSDIAKATSTDPALSKLIHALQFDLELSTHDERQLLPYLPFRDSYYTEDGVILYNDRVVIPPSLRSKVLSNLHAAHQGVSSMERRARATVFWPGITQDIKQTRQQCIYCNRTAPSQAATPPIPSDPPSTPFEKIFADYFDYAGRHFLVIGDRFSGWTDVFATPQGSHISGAAALTRLLRSYSGTFGVPEELSTDGGPEFTASTTQDFLQIWGITHRISSAYFPQSNGRAEVAVKTAKRLLMSNLKPNGDLNSDAFLRAMLQLRNTPDPDCGLSPAEIVFGRPLRDAFAFVNRLQKFSNRHVCRAWRETWKAKESAHRLRAKKCESTLRSHSRSCAPLKRGDRVFIQNQSGPAPLKWDKVGSVVEVLKFDQYNIKVDGSGRITKRNRRFLRPMTHSSSDPTSSQRSRPVLVAEALPPMSDPLTSLVNEPSSTDEPSSAENDDSSCAPSAQQNLGPKTQNDVESDTSNCTTSPRRSNRKRSPALELDPASGRWVARGSSS